MLAVILRNFLRLYYFKRVLILILLEKISDMSDAPTAGYFHSYDAYKFRWYWILRAMIAIATVIGNGLVVYIIAARHKLRHKNANQFVVSLCVADLCTGLFITPAEYVCAYRQWNPCSREVQLAMFEFFVYASALGLCALTFDRYMAVDSSLRYQTIMTSKRVHLLIAMSWFLPLVSSLLHFSYLFGDFELRRRAMKVFAVLESIVFVALPCFLLPLAYIRILFIVRRHSLHDKTQRAQIDFNYSVATASDVDETCRNARLTFSDVDGPHGDNARHKEQDEQGERRSKCFCSCP